MRRQLKHDEGSAEINITPMLDIVFIMLIFFIVTTSFVKEIAVDVSRPSDQPQQQKEISEVIAIRITGSGDILIDNRVVDIRAVRASIEGQLAARPDAGVVVIASRSSDAGLLVRVIDQARVAGAGKVSLAAEAT